MSIFVFSACTDYNETKPAAAPMPDAPVLTKDHLMKGDLVHRLDTARHNIAADYMDAVMTVFNRVDGEITDSMSFTANPAMKSEILVEKDDYIITEDFLNPVVENTTIDRNYVVRQGSEGGWNEIDTVRFYLNDSQILTIPVQISNFSRVFGEDEFFFGSDTLKSARLKSVTNLPYGPSTRATYISAVFNTEYVVELTFAEKNTQRDSVFTVDLTAYAVRKVISEDDIDNVKVANKNRVVIDANTERLSFDRVITMKSGEVISENISYVLNRNFAAIDPYEKMVSSFAFGLDKVNGVADGSESAVKTDGSWNVFGRTDKYSANISNKIEADLFATDYTLYHERAIYKDSFIEVEFGYEGIEVTEVTNDVTTHDTDKEGYDKAIYNNGVKAMYLNYAHDMEEKVFLYMPAKKIESLEIKDASLAVKDDKVVATLTLVTKYTDGTEATVKEEKEFPRQLEAVSNWTAKESNAEQKTDTAVVVLTSTNTQSDGYWSYTNETRSITTEATLAYGYTHVKNEWKSVTPNHIVYTREGKTYEFPAIAFAAKENGAKVELQSNENGTATYKYTDKLVVTYGNNVVTTTAPGTIIVDGRTVRGYDYKDAKLTISDETVTASLTLITNYVDGTSATEPKSKSFDRVLSCTTNWTAYEPNAEETTGDISVTMASSEDVIDGEWIYTKEVRNLTSITTLSASTQNNLWTSVEPNNILFAIGDLRVDFGAIKYSAVKDASVVELSKVEKNVETYSYACDIIVKFGENTKYDSAPGTIIVEKEKAATGHDLRDKNVTVNDNDVTISFTYVTSYNDDTEETETVSKSFPRSITCFTNWSASEKSEAQETGKLFYEVEKQESKTDGFWSYTNETYVVKTFAQLSASTQTNGWRSVNPNKFVYTRDGESYEFDEIEFKAEETGATVTLTKDRPEGFTYSYEDAVNIIYGNNSQRVTAPGQIFVERVIEIIGFDIINTNLLVNPNNVIASLTWVTKYSDGSETKEDISKTFNRSFKSLTNWASSEENAEHSTSEASTTLDKSDAKAESFWTWVEENRKVVTIAQLAGSSQNNAWQSVDPNAITFTREGKTFSFGSLDFTVQETGSKVSVASEDDEKTVYDYQDNIAVNFGDNTINGTAPGKITVEKPWVSDFPAEWGKFVKATCTVAANEEVKDWVYTWSLHFEHGTLPVVVRKNDNAANIDQSLFENVVDTRYNGASYVNGAWVNSIASDEANYMIWTSRSSSTYRIVRYSTATMWNWNNGHNTVKSDMFTFSVENGGKVLVIKKDGKLFASYKAAK